jgi:hypothetical protein
MWTMQQKAEFVLGYAELKSFVTVQCKWQRSHPGEEVPDDKALNRWLKQFKEMGSAVKQKSSGQPGTSEENVECIGQSCVRSPKKSIACLSLELGIPETVNQNVIHKHLRLYAYNIQLKNEIKPDDQNTSRTLCMVKRFRICGTYYSSHCNGNSRYDSVDLA